jgi:hypothetical protein
VLFDRLHFVTGITHRPPGGGPPESTWCLQTRLPDGGRIGSTLGSINIGLLTEGSSVTSTSQASSTAQ